MYTIEYHAKVRSDFQKIDAKHVGVLLDQIETKLAEDPAQYGKPLRQTLKGFRSLRVGNYRIVYMVENNKLVVLIVMVGRRDSVYKEAERRV